MPHSLVKYHIHGDHTGSLIACQANIDVPFEIKRIYYIFDTKPNITRGKHAHKKLKQVLIALSGSCKVTLEENKVKTTYILNQPDQGLYIDGLVWREMSDFLPHTVLLVLASDYYRPADYIRNYQDFIKLTDQNLTPNS